MKNQYAIRKKGGDVFRVVKQVGDEICIIEYFSFASKQGRVYKPLKLWHRVKEYLLFRLV